MKMHRRFAAAAVLALLFLASCANNDKKAEPPEPVKPEEEAPRTVIDPALLPSRFRQAGYLISEQTDSASGGDAADLDKLQLKVGANIATREPITLREAMKALVRNKKMSLSWAPDVNQDLMVDIDVTANDNFYEAIDNILRQLDYFHEVEGSTLVIKYRETQQYHIAMPFIKQEYTSSTGVKSLDSFSKLGSTGNTFDIWENIQKNIDSIIKTWAASVTTPEVKADKPEDGKAAKAGEKKDGKEAETASASVSRRVSSTESTYTIDKPVGLITVNAPKSLQKRVADYLRNLEKELYKQIVIEAKIIEVRLDDSSSFGINWNQLLDGLNFEGLAYGKSTYYNKDEGTSTTSDSSTSSSDTTTTTNSTSSSSTSSTDGTANKTASSSSNNSSTNNSTDSSTSSTADDGTDSTSTSGSDSSSTSGSDSSSTSGTTSDGTIASAISTANSSLNSTENVIVDSLTTGTSVATFVTAASGISEGFATGVSLAGFNFTSFIKALQEQGETTVLSNPKISVMNGQPSLISVGKNVTFIDKVSTTINAETKVTTYTVSTDKLLSGVGLALSAVVKGDKEIIMNLVPITSELSEPIDYIQFGGTEGAQVGLPVVNMREMSTTVKIKDGSMLVVGGLISETDTKDSSYIVPGAENIPYLKYLFGYEEKRKIKRELIILLRPRIIN